MKKIAASILCAGCAGSRYVQRPRPSSIVASSVRHGDGTFEGVLGVKLFEPWWVPAQGEARAVLVIVHGLKDHSSRYAEFADRLAQHGYAVRAFDLRGHGSSEGARAYVSSFDEYTGDLDTFVKRVRKEGKPLFVLGHSMGGAIATAWVLSRKPQLSGLLLSAAALKADVSGFTHMMTSAVGTVLPRLAVFSLDLVRFSRDPKVVAQSQADPLVEQGNGPARTARELLSAMDFVQAHLGELAAPVLAMHGSADEITLPEGSRELVRRARSADKSLKIYHGLAHDLLHEPEKQQVMEDVTAWMDARVR